MTRPRHEALMPRSVCSARRARVRLCSTACGWSRGGTEVFRSEVAARPLCWTAPRPQKSRGLLPAPLFSLSGPGSMSLEDWWPYSACPSRLRRWHLLVWLPVLLPAPLGSVARSLVIEVLCASHTCRCLRGVAWPVTLLLISDEQTLLI